MQELSLQIRATLNGEHQALVDELRAILHEDYDNIVLGEEIFPDPPHRGPHCTAHIFLKPGAQPKKTEADIVARRKKRCYDCNCTELVEQTEDGTL